MTVVLNIEPNARQSRIPALFRQAFRPFFLGGTAFGLAALWAWITSFLFATGFEPFGGGLWWHAHEMLFGFTGAIIAGFLLTAVQNWTNIPATRGWPLAGLAALWLAARLGLAFPVLPSAALTALDLAFFPAVAYSLGRPIWRLRQWRNLVFLPILLALTLCNALMHAAYYQGSHGLFDRGSEGALFFILLLITVIGGRVIPFFTARGTDSETIAPQPLLERVTQASTALAALVALADAWQFAGGVPAAVVAGTAALAHGVRQARWRPWSTGRVPLLWSLHLAYACLAPGYALMAAHALGYVPSDSPVLHVFTVGALAGLVLAMIARVSLGHSGRPLVLAPVMKPAFAAMTLAVLLRAGLPVLGVYEHWLVYVGSAAAWTLAYGLFLGCYAPILCRSRADGRMG